jgi:ATP-binding cassette subfamily B protein
VTEAGKGLVTRFPALRRLMAARRGKVPFVPQFSNVECGVACLAMVLAYHGKHVAREELRSALGPTRDGVRAAHLLRGARHFGLRARAFKGDLQALRHTPRGSILHWQLTHYVVLQSAGKAHVEIVDPALGPRRLPWKEVDKAFTGVVLTFEPGSDFVSGPRGKRHGFYRSLLRSGDWTRILTMSFAAQLVTLGLPLLVSLIVDRVLPRGDARLLYVVGFGLSWMVGFSWLTQLVRGHLLLNLRTSFDAKLTMELVERMLSLPYSFFQQRSTGDLVLRLNSTKMVREILTSGALSAVLDGSFMLVYLLLLSAMSPIMGLVVVGLGLVNVLVLFALRGKRRAFCAELLVRQAECEDYQFELLNAIQTLKGMGCEDRAQERWSNLFVDLLNNQLAYGRLEIAFQAFTSALRLGAPLLIFSLGAREVLGGALSVGAMLAVNTFAIGVFDPLSRLVEQLDDFERLHIYLERMLDVHESPPEQPRGLTRVHERLSGLIELDQVSFRHGPLEHDVIQQVSLQVKPGEFIGIVGASGSGKSTLASLMLGIYPPTQGRVLYDGRSLQELDLRSVREQIGVVTQDTHLFAGTVRANIALANPELPLGEIEHAARLARIHDDIVKMPMGYSTLLSSGGGAISGGQRQRIALARALLRRPAILVLDEATSALDLRNEAGVQEALASLRCTRIVIAHRPSTVAAADRILVVEAGRIIEQGAPSELLQHGGAYARLLNAGARSRDDREASRDIRVLPGKRAGAHDLAATVDLAATHRGYEPDPCRAPAQTVVVHASQVLRKPVH